MFIDSWNFIFEVLYSFNNVLGALFNVASIYFLKAIHFVK